MSRFQSKLTESQVEDVIGLASLDYPASKIRQVVGEHVSVRTIQRVVSAHRSEVEARKRAREQPKRSRGKRASEHAGGREAPGSVAGPAVSGGLAQPEPRYASELGPNARERAGLSAMPEELSTEQYLRAQGHTALVKVGEATLGEDGPRSGGMMTEEAAAELYRRTGRYPPEVLLALAVAGNR